MTFVAFIGGYESGLEDKEDDLLREVRRDFSGEWHVVLAYMGVIVTGRLKKAL